MIYRYNFKDKVHRGANIPSIFNLYTQGDSVICLKSSILHWKIFLEVCQLYQLVL